MQEWKNWLPYIHGLHILLEKQPIERSGSLWRGRPNVWFMFKSGGIHFWWNAGCLFLCLPECYPVFWESRNEPQPQLILAEIEGCISRLKNPMNYRCIINIYIYIPIQTSEILTWLVMKHHMAQPCNYKCKNLICLDSMLRGNTTSLDRRTKASDADGRKCKTWFCNRFQGGLPYLYLLSSSLSQWQKIAEGHRKKNARRTGLSTPRPAR